MNEVDTKRNKWPEWTEYSRTFQTECSGILSNLILEERNELLSNIDLKIQNKFPDEELMHNDALMIEKKKESFNISTKFLKQSKCQKCDYTIQD